MIISITGQPGSGKSTIAKRLADSLGYENYYMGELRRKSAKKRNMTLAEYNAYGENHSETDFEVDEYQKKLGQTNDNFIIQGRTSWFLIPHSLKLFFKVDPIIGATRVWQELQTSNSRNEDKILHNIKEVLNSHGARIFSDELRYKKYYNINCNDPKNFDFIVDTTDLTPDEVFQQTFNFIKKHKQNA